MISNGHIRHDPNLVATSIIELICDDLKYQDKENDPQYVMLNTKLREEKRINKIKKAMEKKEKKNEGKNEGRHKEDSKKGKSKFSTKYSDRIASIREADAKSKVKIDKDIAKKLKKVEKEEKENQKEISRQTKVNKMQSNLDSVNNYEEKSYKDNTKTNTRNAKRIKTKDR